MDGQRHPQHPHAGRSRGVEKFFVYHQYFGSIAAATSTTVWTTAEKTSQVKLGYMFELRMIGALVFQGAAFAAQGSPPLLIQITDSGDGVTLFESPVPLHTVAACSGQVQPWRLPSFRRINGGGTITVQITNLDTGNAYVPRIDLIGAHLPRGG